MTSTIAEELPESLRFIKLMEEHDDPLKAAKLLGYYENETPEQVANRLLRDPEVQLFLQDSSRDLGEGKLLSPQECLEALTNEARNGDSSKDRMAAIQLFMKATGMLDEKIKVESTSSVDALDLTKLSLEEIGALEAIMTKASA